MGGTERIERDREGIESGKAGRTRPPLNLSHDLADAGAFYQAIEDDHQRFLIFVGKTIDLSAQSIQLGSLGLSMAVVPQKKIRRYAASFSRR